MSANGNCYNFEQLEMVVFGYIRELEQEYHNARTQPNHNNKNTDDNAQTTNSVTITMALILTMPPPIKQMCCEYATPWLLTMNTHALSRSANAGRCRVSEDGLSFTFLGKPSENSAPNYFPIFLGADANADAGASASANEDAPGVYFFTGRENYVYSCTLQKNAGSNEHHDGFLIGFVSKPFSEFDGIVDWTQNKHYVMVCKNSYFHIFEDFECTQRKHHSHDPPCAFLKTVGSTVVIEVDMVNHIGRLGNTVVQLPSQHAVAIAFVGGSEKFDISIVDQSVKYLKAKKMHRHDIIMK